MKKIIIFGLIAGFAASIVKIILNLSGLFELFSTTSYIPPIDNLTMVKVEITWFLVWGVIFAALFAFFYDYIPSEGIKKGLIFSLIIWVPVFLRIAVVAAAYGYHLVATPLAVVTFISTCITYGTLIGILYKK